MIKEMFVLATLATLAVNGLQAEGFGTGRFQYDLPGDAAYASHEFSLDLFGGYATRDKQGRDTDAWGTGAGINYFFTPNFGLGADTYIDAFEVPYQLNASAIFRYPLLDTGLAPYGFAGFGRQWEFAPQWNGHVGLGLEFRLNSRTGIFLDGRRVFAGETKDFCLWRAGLRLGF